MGFRLLHRVYILILQVIHTVCSNAESSHRFNQRSIITVAIRFQFFCESGGKGCIGFILEINIIKAIVIMIIIRDFSFSAYAKFSEKLAFLIPAPFLDAQTYVCLSWGKKC